jgi:adenylate kinase
LYLILLGPPGSGKGTQAQIVAKRFGWLHVSTGDMLRAAVAAGSALGEKAKSYMDRGALVPDELVVAMLIERIEQPDAQAGFVLDGYPRNLAQARALDEALATAGKAIDLAVHIDVPDDELVRRLGGRWLCRSCGAIYQEASNPPKTAGRCDNCGGELYQREDDRPETVRNRLEQQKPPADLLDHYRENRRLVEIDGLQAVERVTDDLVRTVGATAR